MSDSTGTAAKTKGLPTKLPLWVYIAASVALAGLVVWAVLALEPDRAVAVSSGVLVLVTAWYAFQTKQMAAEMAFARAEQVRPHLTLDVDKLGAGNVMLRVTNAGIGAALDIDVSLTAEPGNLSILYKAPLLVPGEGQSFLVRDTAGKTETDLKRLVHNRKYYRVNLTGDCHDALGRHHPVSANLDLKDYSDLFYSGLWRAQPDELKRIADELKRIADGQ